MLVFESYGALIHPLSAVNADSQQPLEHFGDLLPFSARFDFLPKSAFDARIVPQWAPK